MPNWLRNVEEVFAVLDGAIPELPRLLEAAGGRPLYVVGGTVRDLMLGRGRTDLDVAVEGDAVAVAHRLGGEVTEHGRFGTAKVSMSGGEIDLAATRAETYPSPGALPEVQPAGIEEDLARRDFTVNAMALPLGGEQRLMDPHSGSDDLKAGVLRVLHPASLRDDPTRALRGARYAARFGLEPDDETLRLLREADLTTISGDRRQAEMSRIAGEPTARAAFELLVSWGLLDAPRKRLGLVEKVAELLAAPPWSAVGVRERAICSALDELSPDAQRLLDAEPEKPSEGVAIARGASPEDLVLARASGAAWLDDYVREWRSVVLEVGGRDLLDAGVEAGPGLGEALAETLRRKLDGEISGRDEELQTAISLTRGT